MTAGLQESLAQIIDSYNCCRYFFLMKSKVYLAEESLGFVAVTTCRLMTSTLRRKFKESDIDLTPEQWGVLLLLWEWKSATQDELALALCVDKSSMSRVLSAMQGKGLVNREIDPTNERKKIICATQKAEVLRERGFSIAGGVLENSLAETSLEELASCIKILNTVKRNLRNKYG